MIYLELYCAIFSSVSCVSCTSCDHPLFPAYIRAVLCNIKESQSVRIFERTMKVSREKENRYTYVHRETALVLMIHRIVVVSLRSPHA